VRIHAIQTGTVAVKTRQRAGSGRWTEPLPILAWVVEHPEGLIVVDTGETARTAQKGYFPRWHPYFRLGVREWVAADEEIGPQLQRLGLSPGDVRWVVLTHLHTDHAGGLRHFRGAEIVLSAEEWSVARGVGGRLRGYLPHLWPRWLTPRTVTFGGSPLPGFPARSLTEAGDVLLVPTPGHTHGHLSVVVRRDGQPDLLLAGDASYTQQLMLDGIIDGVASDARAAHDTLARLQRLTRQQPTVYLPAHDPHSARRFELDETVPL
jgi:N-acyl homoserine lactone hydrolase